MSSDPWIKRIMKCDNWRFYLDERISTIDYPFSIQMEIVLFSLLEE